MLRHISTRLRVAIGIGLAAVATYVWAFIGWSTYSATTDTYADRVAITYAVAVGDCSTSVPFQLTFYRDGVQFNQFDGVSGTLNDTGATPGATHSYTIKATITRPGTGSGCSTAGVFITSPAFTGRRLAVAPTAFTLSSASDGLFVDRVRVSYSKPDISSMCATATHYLLRDGINIATIATGVAGTGAGTYDDLTAAPGTTYSYSIRSDCATTSLSSTSSVDTGYASSVVPPAPTAVTATDGSFIDRVQIGVVMPAAPGCSAISVVIARDGSDLTTVSGVPVTGGSVSFDDFTSTPGVHSYTARALCTPGGNASPNAAPDTGYFAGTPAAVSSISASDGAFSDRTRISFTAPSQVAVCSAISYVIVRDGVDVGTSSFTTLSGGAVTFDDLTTPVGVHTWNVRSVCSPGGATALGVADTGYRGVSPLAPSAVSASDGSATDRVSISWTAPDQSPYCSSIQYSVLRNGTQIALSPFTVLTGGLATYDDMSAAPSVSYSYAVTATCTPGGFGTTSSVDAGYRAGLATAVTGVSASDGTVPGAVRVTFTAPDQSPECSSITYTVVRAGSDIGVAPASLTGGPGQFDDTTAAPGVSYSYSVRSTCSLGGQIALSGSDTGYVSGAPIQPAALSASDGAFNDRIRLSFTAPDQSSQCAAIAYTVVRDGADIATLGAIPLTGGAQSFDDMAVSAGSHSYSVRAACSPGGASVLSATDTGYKLGTPAAASAVAASDGAFSDRIRVSFAAPDQTAVCTTVSYTVVRDGSDLSVLASVPLAGGASSYDDMTVSAGTHSYTIRATCSPGGATASSSSDTGFKLGSPSAPTSVAATDGTMSGRVQISFVAPDQTALCSSISYTVTRDGSDVAAVAGVPLTGASAFYDDIGATPGVHSYAVRATCTPGGGTALSAADTGFIQAIPSAPISVVASDGTFGDRVRISWTAPDQTPFCASVSYVVRRGGADIATVSSIALAGGVGTYDDLTVPAGVQTYSVYALCQPGSQTALSATDTGFKAALPGTPSSVVASDGSFSGFIRVSFVAPDQSGSCASILYTVVADGTDVLSMVSVPLTGGSQAADISSLAPGLHNIAVRATCTPGGGSSLSAVDSGYQLFTPATPGNVQASDSSFGDRVSITFDAPNQTALCAAISYVVVRNGVDLATLSSVPLAGSAGVLYDDFSAVAGTSYAYSVRAQCTPGAQAAASASDSGARAFTPTAPTISASDYTIDDRVTSTLTVPAAAGCSLLTVYVSRDGTDIGSVSLAGSGGTTTYDDLTASFGTHTYGARSVCTPGGIASSTNTDLGGRRGWPVAPSVIAASDFTLGDRVRINVTLPASPECTSRDVVIARDGVDITTITGVPVTGGATTYDDITVGLGVHTYTARSLCAPSGTQSSTVSDTGALQASAPAPSSLTASDYLFADRVTVSGGVPAAAQCATRDVVLRRDGAVIATLSSVSMAGGTFTYDDFLATPGLHTYSAESVCGPSGSVSSAISDTGAMRFAVASCSAVSASPAFFLPGNPTATVSVTGVANAGTIRVRAWGALNGASDEVFYATTGTGSSRSATIAFANHAPGSPEYGQINVEARVTGQNPGDVETVCASTSFALAEAPTPLAVAATDATLLDRVRIAATIPAPTGCSSLTVEFLRGGVVIGSESLGSPTSPVPVLYEDIGGPAGPQSYSVRTVCVAAGSSSTSAPVGVPGSRSYGAPICPVVTVPQPKYLYSAAGTVPVTVTGPTNFASIRFTAYNSPSGANDLASYGLSVSGADRVGTIALSNHAIGSPEYGLVTVTVLATGMDVGATEQVCATTTFEVVQACGVMTVTGPSGTGSLPATVTWNADPAAQQYRLQRAATASGPWSDVGVYPTGTTSASVPGWPAEYFRVHCLAPDAMGNATSAPVQISGNPPPLVATQTFLALNPGTSTVVPSVSDPDGSTAYTLAITVPPSHGTAVVVGQSINYTPTAGYAGLDPFTVSATDVGGGVGTAVLTAEVQTVVLAAPASVAATDGTQVGSVGISWSPVSSASAYKVLRRTSASDPAPVVVAQPSASSVNDSTAAPGLRYYYSVVALNGTTPSPESSQDTGFADTPVSALSWTTSTPLNTAVEGVPNYVDPDIGDTPTFTVLTQPANGTAAVLLGRVRYVPSTGFSGTDTFTISATDRAGAVATGNATISVSCQAPSLSIGAITPARVFADGGFVVTANYDTFGCAQPQNLVYELLSGTSVVATSTVSASGSGAQTARIDLLAPSAAGTYSVRMSVQNTITSTRVDVSAPLNVVALRPPRLLWAASDYLLGVETALLRVLSSPDCVITNDLSVASADPMKCLVEMTVLPPGVAGAAQTSTISYSGVPTAAGTYATTAAVSVITPAGTKRQLATVAAPIQVLPLSSMVFATPATVTTKQFVEAYAVAPAQSAGPDCQLTTEVQATQLAASGRRGCVVDWPQLPSDGFVEGNFLKGVQFSSSSGTASWQVSVLDAAGVKHSVQTGSLALAATVPALGFSVSMNPARPYELLSSVTLGARSSGADACPVTADIAEATRLGYRNCLFEWGTLPGFVADASISVPTMRGVFQSSGPVAIPWNVSIMYQGVKRQVMLGSTPVQVEQAAPPLLQVDRMRQIAPGKFAVPVGGGFVGMLSTSTTQGQVNGTSVAGAEPTTTFTLGAGRNRQPLVVGPSSLYVERQFDVTLALSAVPALQSTSQFTLVAVPRDGLKLRINSPPTSAPDTTPLSVSATIVQPTTSGLQYVAADAGQWEVVFGEVSSSGSFVPLASPVQTDSSGVATAQISLAGRTALRLQARATPVSPYPGYSPTLTSFTSVVTVSKGTVIGATLTSSAGSTGPAPFLSAYRVQFNSLADHIFNDQYAWSISSDSGVTWTPVSGADGPQFALRLPAGSHLLKVQLRNRATQQTSETPPLAIEVYNVPKIVVTGPTYLYPGSTGAYTASPLNAAGAPYGGASVEWSIAVAGANPTDPPLASGVGSTISFSPSAAGTYRLTVRARDGSTSASDPKAWAQSIFQILVLPPAKPAISVSGPIRAEVGKPASWMATSTLAFDQTRSVLSTDGEWTLPDGTVVPGRTLNWSPTSADLSLNPRPVLKYSGWVTGYRVATTSVKTFPITLWEYVWPTWRLSKAQTSSMAPSNVSYMVTPNNNEVLPLLEGLTYTWTVPPTITVLGTPGSKLAGTVPTAAVSPVSVTVMDSRGNSETLTDSLVVSNPPPVVLDFTPANLSPWNHAPITIGITVKATGGNPLDPVSSWSYFVDGQQVSTANVSTARITLPNAQSYSVEARVVTRNGAQASRSVTVNVHSNAPATCAPAAVIASTRRSVAVRANCVDPDGQISRYQWQINGVALPATYGANFTYGLPATQVFPVVIDLVAVDDGGATTSASVSVQ